MHQLDAKQDSLIECAARVCSIANTGYHSEFAARAYFAHLDRMLREEFGVADVVFRRKANYSAPADAHIVDEIKNWQAVVTGVGD